MSLNTLHPRTLHIFAPYSSPFLLTSMTIQVQWAIANQILTKKLDKKLVKLKLVLFALTLITASFHII